MQVNFCKNPHCANFGVPASLKKYAHRSVAEPAPGTEYTITGHDAGVPQLKCRLCNEHLPMKSNQGIAEEIERLGTYQIEAAGPSCPNNDCANHTVPVTQGKASYYSKGLTDRGSPRYECRLCGKSFSTPCSATLRQRQSHKNNTLFKLLMGKMPFARICDVLDIQFKTLYERINFFHRQCLAFAAKQERKLLEGMAIKRLYVAVDRQVYAVNWTQRKDKRNVVMQAIGSADLASGYVFGMHLNFDSALDSLAIEAAAQEAEVRAKRCEAFYVRLAKEMTVDEKRKAIAASRAAFDEALAANKGATPAEVEVLMMKAEIERAAAIGKWSDRWATHPFPNSSEPNKAVCWLTSRQWDSEDESADNEKTQAEFDDHMARLHLKASLHAIDCFFMQVRRRLSLLERPIGTSSKAGRTWYGYSAYKPENIVQLLDIFRVYYNYCLVGKDGKTPAMRLGLVAKAMELEDILA